MKAGALRCLQGYADTQRNLLRRKLQPASRACVVRDLDAALNLANRITESLWDWDANTLPDGSPIL